MTTLIEKRIVVVTAAVIRSEDIDGYPSFWMAQRHQPGTPSHEGWHFPGGKLEYGETTAQCVVREIWEEFRCRIRPVHKLPPQEGVSESGSGHYIVLIPFLCVTDGKPDYLTPSPSTGNADVRIATIRDLRALPLMEPGATCAIMRAATGISMTRGD